jgi:hypothetical protein
MPKKKAARSKTIIDTMDDAGLFKSTFRRPLLGLGSDSWKNWRVFLAGLFALPMSAADKKIYQHFTQRCDTPEKVFREAYIVCGRRSGKSVIAALIGIYLAIFVDHSQNLIPGESAMVLILSSDRNAAQIIFRYVTAFLQAPLLKNLVVGEPRKESISLSNGVTIAIGTANYRSIRGYTVVACIADEVAFWQDHDAGGKNPDSEIFAALKPAMISIPKAMLIVISSPYKRSGELWRNYNLFFGQASPDVLVWQGASGEMNPSLPKAEIEKARQKDPISWESEYNAQFREDSDAFISLEMILERTARGITSRSYDEGKKYYAFVDNSGGKNDSAVLSIAHFASDHAVLDCVREIAAPHNPQSAIREFCRILKIFHCGAVFGDSYAASFAGQHYENNGIEYRKCELTRSEIYLAVLPHLLSNNILLLDLPLLQEQFCALERKPGRVTDIIDHGSGKSDDVCNSVSGVLELVLRDNVISQLGLLEFEKQIANQLRRDPSLTPPKKAATRRVEPPQPVKTPCPACGSCATVWVPGGVAGKAVAVFCNQCHATDGVPPKPDGGGCLPGCPGFLPQNVSGQIKCGNCGGMQGSPQPVQTGCTFKQLAAVQNSERPFRGMFDSVGRRR